MIDVNLVPPHLREKRKGGLIFARMNIPLEVVVGCAGGLFALLVFIHISLLLVNVQRLASHQTLKNKWENMLPEKEKVDSVINELRVFQGKYKAVEDIIIKGDLSWSHKLNLLSDNLPRGMWFKKVALDDKMLFIEGSAISRDASEIINVHHLTSKLKDSEEFMKDFADLELGSIQRRKIKSIEIADFVITVRVK